MEASAVTLLFAKCHVACVCAARTCAVDGWLALLQHTPACRCVETYLRLGHRQPETLGPLPDDVAQKTAEELVKQKGSQGLPLVPVPDMAPVVPLQLQTSMPQHQASVRHRPATSPADDSGPCCTRELSIPFRQAGAW